MTNKKYAVRARVHGQVQGVWYRGWCEHEAKSLGLCGFVRNRLDGTVETLFVGSKAAVEEMLARCKDGPAAAVVSTIETEPAMGITPNKFEIKPTV